MNSRSILDALISGGKKAFTGSAAGCTILLAYSLLTQEKVIYLPYALTAVALASVLWGGLRGGMAAPTMGWLHGLLVAVFYVFLILFGKILVFPAAGHSSAGLPLVLGVLAVGSAGGIIGINLKFIRRRNKRHLNY